MKSICSTAVFVAVGVLAVLTSNNNAVADASPVSSLKERQQRNISQRWCDAFIENCNIAANEACSSTRTAKYGCSVSFSGNECTKGNVQCTCGPLGGNGPMTDISKAALEKNFLSTQGTCKAAGITTILDPVEEAKPSQGATPSQAAVPSSSPDAPKSGASKSAAALSTVAFTAAVSLGLLYV
ncbi:hypothetical protein KVV02_002228 [Mortierella alpina]|uniref:Uncharacterized protein n=1 Tax=Mortierella alpina TaxID=64518 RepID=A0A9P8A2N9_MORAP|nr:hypothetical protein KVV02_002228 [Mortierella alpina]